MSENLRAGPQPVELDLERRRIALKTAAELHDARDIAGLMATASRLYAWLLQPSRQILGSRTGQVAPISRMRN